MPQFDFYSFPAQNFYLLLAFVCVYFIVLFYYLPNFSEVFKMRKKLINYYAIKNTNAAKFQLVSFFYAIIFRKK